MVTPLLALGKRALALAAIVLLVGCASPRQVPQRPVAVVTAFADDFHSGLVLDIRDAPAWLVPPEARLRPYLAVHFGERHWMDGSASTACDALRLVVVPGPGAVQLDAERWIISDCGSADPRRMRTWDFPVDARQLAALGERIARWSACAVREPLGPTTWSQPSVRNWSVWCNCHHFTADLLAAIGVDLGRAPILLADGLRAGLDRAWDAEQDVALPAPVR
jgi:hypothetical protein